MRSGILASSSLAEALQRRLAPAEDLPRRRRQGDDRRPPVIGQFTGKRGEFFHQEDWKGRTVLVRYVWLDLSPTSARMEQSFSDDGGKTWEVNWICELTR